MTATDSNSIVNSVCSEKLPSKLKTDKSATKHSSGLKGLKSPRSSVLTRHRSLSSQSTESHMNSLGSEILSSKLKTDPSTCKHTVGLKSPRSPVVTRHRRLSSGISLSKLEHVKSVTRSCSGLKSPRSRVLTRHRNSLSVDPETRSAPETPDCQTKRKVCMSGMNHSSIVPSQRSPILTRCRGSMSVDSQTSPEQSLNDASKKRGRSLPRKARPSMKTKTGAAEKQAHQRLAHHRQPEVMSEKQPGKSPKKKSATASQSSRSPIKTRRRRRRRYSLSIGSRVMPEQPLNSTFRSDNAPASKTDRSVPMKIKQSIQLQKKKPLKSSKTASQTLRSPIQTRRRGSPVLSPLKRRGRSSKRCTSPNRQMQCVSPKQRIKQLHVKSCKIRESPESLSGQPKHEPSYRHSVMEPRNQLKPPNGRHGPLSKQSCDQSMKLPEDQSEKQSIEKQPEKQSEKQSIQVEQTIEIEQSIFDRNINFALKEFCDRQELSKTSQPPDPDDFTQSGPPAHFAVLGEPSFPANSQVHDEDDRASGLVGGSEPKLGDWADSQSVSSRKPGAGVSAQECLTSNHAA
eukprot:863879_1